MAFQPFGYPFLVRSHFSPSQVKAHVRSRTKTLFDPKNGARGWIVGPFICLWFSAFDRYGPMLVGRISRDDLGTKIGGRAGSNLNGVAMFAVLMVMMALIAVREYLLGNYPVREIAMLGGIIAIMSPLMLWGADKYKADAEPLVRFLRNAVVKPDHSPRAQPALPPLPATFPKFMTLEVSGSVLDGPATPASVRDALLEIESDGFIILSSAEEAYLQSVGQYDGYVIEKRDGGDQNHYRAARLEAGDLSSFTFEETLAVFLAYGSEAPMPSFLEWKKIRL
jgi:hypothetical protein